jgi:hypothetical protein
MPLLEDAMTRSLVKADAIARLERQKAVIAQLKRMHRGSPDFKKWHRDTEVAISNIFGNGERHLSDFTSIRYSVMIASSVTPDSDFQEAYVEGLERADAILASLIDEVREYWEDRPVPPKAPVPDALEHVTLICRRFPLVVRQLRDRHAGRPPLDVDDEYDVQDLLHSLLTLFFDDIRPEEWTPSYAGGSARMDFLLKDHGVVVEVKKTRKGLGARELGDELMVDIQRYSAHPECKILVCFAYDPEGRVANPRGIEKDLSGQKGTIAVRTIIVP